jgi:hypothetical protein
MPGFDVPDDEDEKVEGATGSLIGRGWRDPLDPSRGCEGPARDVALYHTLIALPTAPPAPSAPPPTQPQP